MNENLVHADLSGAALAADHGLGFAFPHHLNPHDAVDMLRAYRGRFRSGRAPVAIARHTGGAQGQGGATR